MICHGIPDDTVIADGDIVNVDITAYIGGVHGDTNATFLAGAVDEESRLLVERTREAMMRGIRTVAPGRPLNAIGRVIESYARRFGYGVVRDFTGHGIGTTFHSGLIVPHFDDPDVTVIMEPGMTFTIEPMLTLGTIAYDIWPDGWTAVTQRPQAHGPVRAHAGGDRGWLRDPDAAVGSGPVAQPRPARNLPGRNLPGPNPHSRDPRCRDPHCPGPALPGPALPRPALSLLRMPVTDLYLAS